MLVVEKQAFKKFLYKEFGAYSSLSFPVTTYLVDLLRSYLYSETFFEKKEGQDKLYEHRLVDLYTKSQGSGFQEKIYIFKKIGDLSLYFCGFFRPAVKKKLIHISYYEQMGQSAYDFISKNHPGTNVFEELSSDFKSLSQILFSLQKKSDRSDSKYLLNFTKKKN